MSQRGWFFRFVVVLVLLAFVGSTAGPANAEDPAVEERSVVDRLKSLGPLSSPVPAEPIKPETPSGDFETALTDRAETAPEGEELSGPVDGEAVAEAQREWAQDPGDAEVVDRDEDSTTYDLGDGLRVSDVSPSPVNVEGSDGEWLPSSVMTMPTGDGVAAVQHPPRAGVCAECGRGGCVDRDS